GACVVMARPPASPDCLRVTPNRARANPTAPAATAMTTPVPTPPTAAARMERVQGFRLRLGYSTENSERPSLSCLRGSVTVIGLPARRNRPSSAYTYLPSAGL